MQHDDDRRALFVWACQCVAASWYDVDDEFLAMCFDAPSPEDAFERLVERLRWLAFARMGPYGVYRKPGLEFLKLLIADGLGKLQLVAVDDARGMYALGAS